MNHLVPCPACNRHVDVVESACPFCATALPAAFRAQQPPTAPRARLGRAALMAAGATLMGAAACSSETLRSADAATDRPAVTKDASQDRSVVAIYGGPRTDGGATSATGGTSGSDGATGAGGTTARDAGEDRSIVALYGAAVASDGLRKPQG